MRIIHIGPDSQFIQFLSGVFESVAPGASRYLITSASHSEELRFPPHSDSVQILARGVRGVMAIPMYVQSCDMIIVHGMSPYGVAAFLTSPSNTVRVWSGWGFDYYGDAPNPDEGLLSPATSAVMSAVAVVKPRSLAAMNMARHMLAYATKKAANRADYFSAPISFDYDVFKRRFEGFVGSYLQLNYGSVAETFSQGCFDGGGMNILVGNSASPTNNHIDVFRKLARHNLGLRKVIVPLSYGDDFYRDKIISIGRDMLGDAFMPLVDFLPLNEYSSIVASCNIVVMNHFRQQALGNVGSALYQGAHVYLNPISPVYKLFNENGAHLNSTENLDLNFLPVDCLPVERVEENRVVLNRFWGSDKVLANVRNLLMCARPR